VCTQARREGHGDLNNRGGGGGEDATIHPSFYLRRLCVLNFDGVEMGYEQLGILENIVYIV
jgi:hypothetical protein